MPFHTIAPTFSLRDFLTASLDYLGTHPLALALVVTAAFLVVCELGFGFARETAKQRAVLRAAQRREAVAQARRDLLKVIASNHGKGAA